MTYTHRLFAFIYTNVFMPDGAGNLTSFKGAARTYNANNQRTGAGFVHDGNGNPTTFNGNVCAFDPENRMTSYGIYLTMGYRGDGLRACRRVPRAPTSCMMAACRFSKWTLWGT